MELLIHVPFSEMQQFFQAHVHAWWGESSLLSITEDMVCFAFLSKSHLFSCTVITPYRASACSTTHLPFHRLAPPVICKGGSEHSELCRKEHLSSPLPTARTSSMWRTPRTTLVTTLQSDIRELVVDSKRILSTVNSEWCFRHNSHTHQTELR